MHLLSLLLIKGADINWSPHQNELREIFRVGELVFTHHALSFVDHVYLHLLGLGFPLGHAVAITVTDHCNNEVHQYNVADKHYQEPDRPKEYMVDCMWLLARNVPISNSSLESHDKPLGGSNSIVAIYVCQD